MTRFVFVKGEGKFDRLQVHRDNGVVELVDCPKQRIIPHDMVHFLVEQVVDQPGFMRRVAAGEAAAFDMTGDAVSDAVERLVETVQADAWSGSGSDTQDVLELYQLTCAARGAAVLPVTAAQIAEIRSRLTELDRQWQAGPVGERLTLYA